MAESVGGSVGSGWATRVSVGKQLTVQSPARGTMSAEDKSAATTLQGNERLGDCKQTCVA
eukprot:354296-Chlamydomonas_euryale.AAC.10